MSGEAAAAAWARDPRKLHFWRKLEAVVRLAGGDPGVLLSGWSVGEHQDDDRAGTALAYHTPDGRRIFSKQKVLPRLGLATATEHQPSAAAPTSGAHFQSGMLPPPQPLLRQQGDQSQLCTPAVPQRVGAAPLACNIHVASESKGRPKMQVCDTLSADNRGMHQQKRRMASSTLEDVLPLQQADTFPQKPRVDSYEPRCASPTVHGSISLRSVSDAVHGASPHQQQKRRFEPPPVEDVMPTASKKPRFKSTPELLSPAAELGKGTPSQCAGGVAADEASGHKSHRSDVLNFHLQNVTAGFSELAQLRRHNIELQQHNEQLQQHNEQLQQQLQHDAAAGELKVQQRSYNALERRFAELEQELHRKDAALRKSEAARKEVEELAKRLSAYAFNK